MLLTLLSILTCIILVISLIETAWGLQSLTRLETISPSINTKDKVSIVITACNEEEHIKETLAHLTNQVYSNIEILCINDRSTDETGQILNNFAKEDTRIKVKHITDLPAGWLGKNHAAYTGASLATGDWLLFIDADVFLKPYALSRALNYAMSQGLDHLSAFAHYKCHGFLYNIVHLVWQGHGLVIPLKPWLAKSRHSKKSMNLGVFCLVKKSVYEACGGHEIAPLECVEDFRLGERIKQSGYLQEVVSAQMDISISWYATLRDHIHGFKKNVFAYFRYRLPPVILGIVGWYVLFVWPEFACFLTDGICQYINLVNTFLLFLLYLIVSKFFKVSQFYAFFYPLGLIVYPFFILSSVYHFYKNRGIYWRGTFYDAETLRKS
ncbi:MAG: glycosyltransferase [Tatlockia sp.]|nr:glycosyltransferase [Tatlockia sp.]